MKINRKSLISKKTSKKTPAKKAAPAPIDVVLTQRDMKAVETLKGFVTQADSLKEGLQQGVSLFKRGYHALSTCDEVKWPAVLDASGIKKDSSYRSSLIRAAKDPEATDKALATTGNINRTIGLLPTQTERTASGSTKRGGRPRKSSEQRVKEQALKAVSFLVANFDEEDSVAMLKRGYEMAARTAQRED